MVEGVQKASDKPGHSKEDTKMSLSHLVLQGYVEDEAESDTGLIRARFRSLKTQDTQDIDNEVSMIYGGRDDRASRSDRNKKYLAKSLIHFSVFDHGRLIKEVRGDEDLMQKEIKGMSQYLLGMMLVLYSKFEGEVSKLMNNADIKNS